MYHFLWWQLFLFLLLSKTFCIFTFFRKKKSFSIIQKFWFTFSPFFLSFFFFRAAVSKGPMTFETNKANFYVSPFPCFIHFSIYPQPSSPLPLAGRPDLWLDLQTPKPLSLTSGSLIMSITLKVIGSFRNSASFLFLLQTIRRDRGRTAALGTADQIRLERLYFFTDPLFENEDVF